MRASYHGCFYDPDGNEIDAETWGDLNTRDDGRARQVARTTVGDVTVSTAWLGINHNFTGHGAPLIFETAVLDGEHRSAVRRYSTRQEAERGHDDVVDLVRSTNLEA